MTDVITAHAFADSGYRTLLTEKPICRCGCVQDHRLHQLPETPPEARELDDRRTGERP